eukprot:m.268598 g.268598  ORF g.268598 m.268598 type:complete len:150 (+) comp26811_c0_seq9:100-549(+)
MFGQPPNTLRLTPLSSLTRPLATFGLVLGLVVAASSSKSSDDATRKKCDTCQAIARMFSTKYAETDTIHFRGESKGWSLDNEKFLGRYKMGEARLAEIAEGLCSKSDSKCNSLMEDLEEPLEEWWGITAGHHSLGFHTPRTITPSRARK